MLVFKEPLLYSVMATKCGSGDAGDSDMPEKPHIASFKWKDENPPLNKEGKQSYAKIAKIYDKNESFIHEISDL